jgi:hypothetical protein
MNTETKQARVSGTLDPIVRCSDCVWVHKFRPRQDEIDRGLTIGCKKPGWEGYSHDDKPACGGVFFTPNSPICVKTHSGDAADSFPVKQGEW